jgi:hypothetical protein
MLACSWTSEYQYCMPKNKWYTLPEMGDTYLETIKVNVERWRFFSGQLKILEAQTADASKDAAQISRNLIRSVIEAENPASIQLERLAAGMPEDQRLRILAASLGAVAVDQIANLEHGTQFRQGYWAVIYFLKPGAYLTSIPPTRPPTDKDFLKDFNEMEPDSNYLEGKIDAFEAYPKAGGQIVLHGILRSTAVRGLVNPVTGEPHVALDILVKN